MTTHLRARWAQAGALLAVVVGGIAVAPAVALADPPKVEITSLSTDVLSGSSVSMSFRVRDSNNGGGAGGAEPATIQVSGMTCQGTCSQIAQVDQNGKDFQVTLKAPTVNAGDTQTVTVTVSATINGESNSKSQPVNVKGPDKPQTVTSISGKVRDQNNKTIPGANVAMKDSAGHSYETTTNGSGAYSFNSTDAQPITPGTISVGALKDGFSPATVSVQASAGKSVSVPLILKAVAATASASPSASASATASTDATDQAAADVPSTGDTAPANTNTKPTASDSSGGSGSTLFLVLGGLLVAGGVGAIVLVLMRRKNNGGGGPEDDPTAMGGGGGGVPPSQGRFNDATRVASPMGMGPGPAQTMMAPRAASSPMADAPTMLQRPVEDEFPDPYGAPVPRQGGNQYGGGGYDQQQPAYGGAAPGGTQQYGGGAQYGQPTQYGQAQDDGYGGGTYGAAAAPAGGGQYGGGAQQRYDEPTGMYQPEADQGGYDSYDQHGGQYGGGQYGGGGYDQGGYADQGGYDQGGQYGGGQGGGGQGGGQYGGGQYGGGQYDGGQGGQYGGGQGGQYGGGYDQGGQYGGGQYGGGAYDQGGYDQAGYDQGGYNEQPNRRAQAQPSHPGQRRSSDWDG
ncbi:carboxypeptidase-like regulatory domain-containing protein [Actinoplanes subtropicus]|uniref:carboxypeptidase-like regulatory domain-containing protein n=1 Tax=Actinoplanes subtropicus TaxID=543632 RepID=UPI0012FAA1A4|nr:carboxypeptidase-like regulatory domain-containing protein [Actinoplanes subtropicus]